jgi:hypothetical protein
MVAKNDITGDSIQSIPSKAYSDNYDAIFRKAETNQADSLKATDEAKEQTDTKPLVTDK